MRTGLCSFLSLSPLASAQVPEDSHGSFQCLEARNAEEPDQDMGLIGLNLDDQHPVTPGQLQGEEDKGEA